jgi:hypothetical protein
MNNTRTERAAQKSNNGKNYSRRNGKKIMNSSEFSTYGLIINLQQVRNSRWRNALEKNCKTTPNNSKAVYVNARAFNYFELLVWLKTNFEMSTDNVCALSSKIYPNKLGKVDVDLTRVVYAPNSCTFVCKVEEERAKFEVINKQLPLFNKEVVEYITPIKHGEQIISVNVEFFLSKVNLDNSQDSIRVDYVTNTSHTTGTESHAQARVRKQCDEAGFEGLMPNTGFVVPNNGNTLVFVQDNDASLVSLKEGGLKDMPYTRINDVNVTPSMLNHITIEDCYNSLNHTMSDETAYDVMTRIKA